MSPACATLPAVTTVPAARDDADPSPAAPLTAEDLVAATGGTLLRRSDRPVRGGAVDSRLVTPGCLFVALPGERTDGHRFLAAAAAAGAAALLVTRPPEAVDLDALGDVTVVLVSDALAGLQAVAAAWRTRFAPLVVGITGSVAKTSTKDATAAVLGAAMPTLRTEGNQNNEVGLPLTLLRLGPEHRAAVLEMGMYVGGEIATLAALGRPSIGIVTAVAPGPPGAGRIAGGDRGRQGGAGRGAAGRGHGDPEPGRRRGSGRFGSRTRAAVRDLRAGSRRRRHRGGGRRARRPRDDVRPGRPRPPPRRASASRSAPSAGTASRTPSPPPPWGSSPASPTSAIAAGPGDLVGPRLGPSRRHRRRPGAHDPRRHLQRLAAGGRRCPRGARHAAGTPRRGARRDARAWTRPRGWPPRRRGRGRPGRRRARRRRRGGRGHRRGRPRGGPRPAPGPRRRRPRRRPSPCCGRSCGRATRSS